jgi:MinD-like ATPase involved in chromosome partitioning or flagellar assembly
MLIAFASLKASPGVTTTTLAVAAMWPQPARVLLVEADPAGGDLAARFGLASEPGLVSLSAAARREHDPELAFAHAQQLPGGLPVIAAPCGAEQAGGALRLLTGDGAPLWANLAAHPDIVVLADCGRLDAASPAHALLAAADVALVLSRPNLAELNRLAGGLDALAARAEATYTEFGLVLAAGPGFDRTEVHASLRIRVWAQLPDDARAATVLTGGARRRGLAGLTLPKSARDLAAVLAGHPSRSPGACSELSAPPTTAASLAARVARSAV